MKCVELNQSNVKKINEANERLGLRDQHFAEGSKIIATALFEIIKNQENFFDSTKSQIEKMKYEIHFLREHDFIIEADAKNKIYSAMREVFYEWKELTEKIEKYAEALDL